MPIVTTTLRIKRHRKISPIICIVIVIGVAITVYLSVQLFNPPQQVQNPEDTLQYATNKISNPVVPATVFNKTQTQNSDPDITSFSDEVAQFDIFSTNEMPIGIAIPRIKRVSEEQKKLQVNYKYPTPGQARLPDGYIVTFKPPEEGQTVKFMIDHEKYVCYPDGTFEIIGHKPIFDDKFEEQLINLAMPGATFLPHTLLNHTVEELQAMLTREIIINPDDSDEVKEKKEAVVAIKQILSDYLADGGDYEYFIMEMFKYSKEERKLRIKGLTRLQDLIDDGQIDEARNFLKIYNNILEDNGFSALRLSKKVKAKLDEVDLQEPKYEILREE